MVEDSLSIKIGDNDILQGLSLKELDIFYMMELEFML